MRTARYILRRAVRGLFTLLLMIAITFAFYFAIMRQPPLGFLFPQNARGAPATPQQIAMARHMFFLDRSKVGLYFQYVGNLMVPKRSSESRL